MIENRGQKPEDRRPTAEDRRAPRISLRETRNPEHSELNKFNQLNQLNKLNKLIKLINQLNPLQCLSQIIDHQIHLFDADGKPDQAFTDTCFGSIFRT